MKGKKPLNSKLPGTFGRMNRKELDAQSDQYDAEFSGIRAPRSHNARPHPKKRGRPRKPAEEKAARVLITMKPELLAATDAAANSHGLSRAGVIREAILQWLGRPQRPRKGA